MTLQAEKPGPISRDGLRISALAGSTSEKGKTRNVISNTMEATFRAFFALRENLHPGKNAPSGCLLTAT